MIFQQIFLDSILALAATLDIKIDDAQNQSLLNLIALYRYTTSNHINIDFLKFIYYFLSIESLSFNPDIDMDFVRKNMYKFFPEICYRVELNMTFNKISKTNNPLSPKHISAISLLIDYCDIDLQYIYNCNLLDILDFADITKLGGLSKPYLIKQTLYQYLRNRLNQ